jgi:hypothetical protein
MGEYGCIVPRSRLTSKRIFGALVRDVPYGKAVAFSRAEARTAAVFLFRDNQLLIDTVFCFPSMTTRSPC